MPVHWGDTAIVAGATSRLGRRLALRLAHAGVHVIAVDTEEAPLVRLARAAPGQMSHLRVPLNDPAMLHLLGDAWGAEPLHILLNVSALDGAEDSAAQIEAKARLVEAVSPGLVAGQGRVVTVLRSGAHGLAPVGLAAALRAMHADIATRLGPEGVRANLVELHDTAPPSAALRPVLALIEPHGVHAAVVPVYPRARRGSFAL